MVKMRLIGISAANAKTVHRRKRLDRCVGSRCNSETQRTDHDGTSGTSGDENKGFVECDPLWPIVPARTERRSYSFDKPGRLDHKIIVIEGGRSRHLIVGKAVTGFSAFV
jgi:hypothetical protein